MVDDLVVCDVLDDELLCEGSEHYVHDEAELGEAIDYVQRGTDVMHQNVYDEMDDVDRALYVL